MNDRVASIVVLHFSLTPFSFFLWIHSIVCQAKHVNDKAARWAASKRPKKSRPSDIHRKQVVYELSSITKPAEYTVSDAPPQPVKKAD